MPAATPARRIAYQVLEDVAAGSFGEEALSERLERGKKLSDLDRGLVTEIVYGVLRWRARLDGIVGRCSNRPLQEISPGIRQVLRIALYQMFLLDRIPDYAAVDQAVAHTRMLFGERPALFVNAVLRRAAREKEIADPPPGDGAESLALYYSHPLWLVTKWLDKLGPAVTTRILRENNSPPPVFLRANTLRISREALVEALRSSGVEAVAVETLPDAVRISAPAGSAWSLPGYDAGLFTMQDCAAQMIAPLQRVEPGDSVLDACASPGGKTSHLAAIARNQAQILAMDIDEFRLVEMGANLARLGVAGVEPILGDAADREFVKTLGLFDRVLVDAPCSNLGVLGRSPEARLRTKPEDPARFAEVQLRMLKAAASVLRPGGALLYSVCTVTEEETTGLATRFLAETPDVALDPITPAEASRVSFVDQHGFFTTFPPPEGQRLDGFFAARFQNTI
jgi:16S rRNA (cytosine967-C5)-methyltransferase